MSFIRPSYISFIKENKDVYKAFIALTIDYTPFYYTAILAGEKSYCDSYNALYKDIFSWSVD